MRIGNKQVGNGSPCYIIAEAGVNHGGKFLVACDMIEVAKKAGADAVKFQLYYPDKSISVHTPQAEYARRAGMTESHKEMTVRLMLSDKEYSDLKDYCDEIGIEFLCTGFDETAVDALVDIGVNALKIPSGEITNLPYLRHCAKTGIPIILSTGMSSLGEVETALDVIGRADNWVDVCLLHCTSNYPADPADVNLLAMTTMRQAFSLPIGLSDHTDGNEIAFAAVAHGACMIEKHFTLDKHAEGPDHQASCTPKELAALVRGIRKIEAALGDGIKRMQLAELDTRNVARKSIVASCDIQAGGVLSPANITVKRPGTGMPPAQLDDVYGRIACVPIEADTIIDMAMLL